MSVSFAQSETRYNLMRAFAGESQARNRYDFAAGIAKQKNLEVLEWIFKFTAGQEQAHAKVYYNFLTQLSGETLQVDGTYPVDIFPEVLPHLRAAQHNELEEYQQVYPGFAKVAEEEGFGEIARTFTQIAAVEKTHGDRLGRCADLLETGKLFVADGQVKWMCLNCGAVVDFAAAPGRCPVCSHGQGYFIRADGLPVVGP